VLLVLPQVQRTSRLNLGPSACRHDMFNSRGWHSDDKQVACEIHCIGHCLRGGTQTTTLPSHCELQANILTAAAVGVAACIMV
jgi:hypothetical protein